MCADGGHTVGWDWTTRSGMSASPGAEPPAGDGSLDKYVDLLLRVGVNVQPGQTLVLGPGVDVATAPVMRKVVARAYELGAADVEVLWQDPVIERLRYERASAEALATPRRWLFDHLFELSQAGAAWLSLGAPDPSILRGIDQSRIQPARRASAAASRPFSERQMKGLHAWCVASLPSAAWAREVYPDRPPAEGETELWRVIRQATRIDQQDPVAAWRAHVTTLNARRAYLDAAHFRALHYRAPGTALVVGLPAKHLWAGAGSVSERGAEYVPNIPTEEVFSVPARDGVSGVVRSTMPVTVNGITVERLSLRFEQGRIVEYGAVAGYDALRAVIEHDDGSHYLGEVALVPYDTPCNVGYPLHNTLFDENASCHLAIGRAYPICYQGGDQMSADELLGAGVNTSDMHLDFMIGSAELDIDGETATGELVPVFRGGRWASDVSAR